MSEGRSTSARRGRLQRLLKLLSGRHESNAGTRATKGERLRLESLETRRLLAGDVPSIDTELMGPIDVRAIDVSATQDAPIESTSSASTLPFLSDAEGEAEPDLVQFAKDIAATNTTFFGAYWCPACTQQKQLFQDGADFLPFIEVTGPDRTINQIGIDNNITVYPTWVFPDNTRASGVLSLEEISQRTGVPIPTSETPSFAEVGTQTALIGSPLHIPINAYDPNGDPLTVTVSVENDSLLEATVLTGNRSIRIDMNGYEDMVFELFEQRAPTATGRVIELAEADFYDGIIFHRVVDDFVIQGGDPTGTGSGGSQLGDFDDDFHPDLQHNRPGILSYAKSGDDTNDSQFFITEVPTRFLDFNHSVFGVLVEGDNVREAISEHEVNSADRPTLDITMSTVDVFNDTENSVIMLKPTGSGIGTTNVTVTVTDGDGNSSSETFQVDVNNDTENSQPFLNDVTVPDSFLADTPATLQLSSTDVEGDPVSYSAAVATSGTGATATISQSGLLTVTPATGFTGVVDVRATVAAQTGAGSASDNQIYRFNFEASATPQAPSAIDLLASSDTGSSDTDNNTNAASLSFQVDGVTNGATVQLINVATNAVVGEGIATGTSITITTNNLSALGDGVYNVAARQRLTGATSDLSSAVAVTYDSTAPSSIVSSANTSANVGRLYQTDLINSEEGSIEYAITQGPSGATIDSGSGLIQWTPVAADLGTADFTVTTTDLAGNVRTDNFSVDVADEPTAEVRLVARDDNGNEITSLNVGQQFVLELVGVDARSGLLRDGVFAIYADILFDSTVVRPQSGATIEYVGDFTLSPKGTFLTGLIDELGAASTQTQASNDAESIIARIPMEAVASGSVNIRSEEADEASSEVLLFGVDNEIPADAVFYGSLNLSVGLDFTLVNDTVAVVEDSGATTVDVLTNDTNSGSGTLAVISVEQPTSGGTVSVSNGNVLFTPTADFAGTTEFVYRAGDGSGAQDTATVTVTVTGVNDPPVGQGDSFNVFEGSSTNRLDVLANDSIAPDTNETLVVTAVGSSSNGATITITSDGSAINYTPPTGFTGTDTFSYTLSDGTASDTVSVNVTVAPSDAPPTAVNDAFTIDEDGAEASFDVLQNDQRDVDNQTFVIDSVNTPSEGGSARISSDGLTFFYEPADNFNGTETVVYTIRDTGGGLSAGTVTFTVDAVNDPPPVSNTTVQFNQGTGETQILSVADLPENVDGDGETLLLTATNGSSSSGGTVRVESGSLFYTPPSSTFTGTDTVAYSVSDGTTTSNGTITVEVTDFTERRVMVEFSSTQAQFLGDSVRLTGTDALGNVVDLPSSVNNDNQLVFENLLPGEYMVEIPAIPFFAGSQEAQQFEINSAAEDGDTMVRSSMGRLLPQYLSMRDWLGQTPLQSAWVVVAPGSSAVLAAPTPSASDSITAPDVSLNAAGTELTILGDKDLDPEAADGDEAVSASALVTRSEIVGQRGQIGDLRLFRVTLDDEVVNYTETASSTASAEGEQTAPESTAAGDNLTNSGAGEGEQVVENPLAIASTAEGETFESATGSVDVAAPMLDLSDRPDTPLAAQDAEPQDSGASDSGTSRLSRMRRVTSSESPDTQASDDDSSAPTSVEAEVTHPLSARRVDRFFRRR
ncbi:MAG: tandem-95 repeat protein [Planctomycetota bacterium]